MGDIGTVMIVGLFVMLILGVPIAITLGLLTAVGVWMADSNPMIMAQRFLAGGSVSSLLAIPGFILAGELMSAGGLSRRLVRVASVFFGHLTGGLSMSTVVAGTFFGAISGSAPATTAAVGSIMIDELAAKGYKRGYAAAGFCVVSVLYARRMGIPKENRATKADILFALRDGAWALLAPVVILGGIYSGIFTPTEAATAGAFYSALIGLFFLPRPTFQGTPRHPGQVHAHNRGNNVHYCCSLWVRVGYGQRTDSQKTHGKLASSDHESVSSPADHQHHVARSGRSDG